MLTNLGLALHASGAAGDAIATLRRSADLNPDDASTNYLLAAALFDVRSDPGDVIRFARRAVTLDPSDAEALTLLGRALAVQGDLREALEFVDRALRLQPDARDALELRQTILAVIESPGLLSGRR